MYQNNVNFFTGHYAEPLQLDTALQPFTFFHKQALGMHNYYIIRFYTSTFLQRRSQTRHTIPMLIGTPCIVVSQH